MRLLLKLEYLNVSSTYFLYADYSGSIPTELGQLSSLTVLDLSVSGDGRGRLLGILPTELDHFVEYFEMDRLE